ncbi:MAG: UDPGP type 1 family protein [Phycisphaerae bacterium]|nr:UDPGP type 1 family protein [Phycisphaerae bacterium]NNF42889.1 UDPGP type 1 family protein [Phycisphaerales bacterium]
MDERIAELRRRLERHQQTYLLRFLPQLGADERATLVGQLEAIDFDQLAQLAAAGAHDTPDAASLVPAPYVPAPPDGPDESTSHHRAAGETLVRSGAVAVLTVAGGQGTRLGWDGPKGTYPATVVTGKPLFRCFAEQILAAGKKYERPIPWLIMTSPANHAATQAFFDDNNFFGLCRTDVLMFSQAMLPSLDAQSGALLLEERDRIALNPDGHGGSLRALASSGALDELQTRGVRHISYVQIDNPLVRVIDPVFLGLHADDAGSSGRMSSKMVEKTDPAEKVGVFTRHDGRTMVIEYSDLPPALAEARDDAGRLRFRAGSIAVHIIATDFVAELTRDRAFALPFHRALKRVPFLDATGLRVEPDTPNAIKFETFVFDALPLAGDSIVLETRRDNEFAPIKNAQGADSPATSHQLQSDRAGRWLEAHGVTIPRDADGHVMAKIEISPLTALEPADLVAVDLPKKVEVGAEVAL